MCFPIRVGDRFTRRRSVCPASCILTHPDWSKGKLESICTFVLVHLRLRDCTCYISWTAITSTQSRRERGPSSICRLVICCVCYDVAVWRLFTPSDTTAAACPYYMNGEIIPKGAPPSYISGVLCNCQCRLELESLFAKGFFKNFSIFLLNRYYLCIRDSRLKVCLTV
jgi:hypothetical protein